MRILATVRPASATLPDHRPCARCGILRKISVGRRAADLCRDCKTVERMLARIEAAS